MAHYAFLNQNNIVTEVITGRDEDEVVDGITDWEAHYGDFRGQVCKRTSYNTIAGKRDDGKEPFRGTYAGIGYTYDFATDAFYPPQPYPSWVFDTDSYSWVAPIPVPDAGFDWEWNEESQSWKELRSTVSRDRETLT
jgi:hypothetical protein